MNQKSTSNMNNPNDSDCVCNLCEYPEEGDMVQCEKCLSWSHFECAHVTKAIKDKPYVCIKCAPKNKQKESRKSKRAKARDTSVVFEVIADSRNQNSSNIDECQNALTQNENRANIEVLVLNKAKEPTLRSHPSTTNASSKRLSSQRLLEVLEEERRMIVATRKQREEEDKLYFTQKKLLISQMDDACSTNISDVGSVSIDIETKNADVEKWAKAHSKAVVESQEVPLSPQDVNSPIKSRVPPKNILLNKHQTFLTSAPLPWLTAKNQQEFLTSAQRCATNDNDTPFYRDVLRQTPDLPIFDGSPNLWPMFITSYMRSTTALKLSNYDNLCRLQKCLKGAALNLVKGYLTYEESVPKAINALRIRFGRPDQVISELIANVQALPRVNLEKLDSLLDLHIAVQHLCVTMQACGMTNHLTNPTLLNELVQKLPGSLKLEWADFKLKQYGEYSELETLSTLDDWLTIQADKVGTVLPSSLDILYKSGEKLEKRSFKTKGKVYSHVDNGNPSIMSAQRIGSKCCVCISDAHEIAECPAFKKANVKERWEIIKKNGLCRKCLLKHFWKHCNSQTKCNVNGCLFKHHHLLHDDVKHVIEPKANQPREHERSNTISIHSLVPSRLLFRVIPVRLFGPRTVIKTFAFLDEGSTRTLLDEKIAQELNLKGPISSLHLKWTGDTTREEKNSRCVSLEISGDSESCKRYRISNVRTVQGLNLTTQSLKYKPTETPYNHLRNLPIASYKDAKPRILIGIEHWQLGLPLKIKEGQWGEPIATKTKLGWTILGNYADQVNSNLNHHYHVCDCGLEDDLHDQVKQFFALESLTTKSPVFHLQSEDDRRAMSILAKTTRKIKFGYEAGLLWKFDSIQLPSSRDMAMKRLICLERRLAKDPVLAENIKTQMQAYLDKGYTKKLTDQEAAKLEDRTWYLPIFPVFNPNKPNKVRIVWDAAAVANGTSLNEMLLKGPDMLCSLINVLFRFREKRFALSGDIKEMYHQVAIRESDQQSQRFLWRNSPNDEPITYVMRVMTFGAACSPTVAQYVKNINALRFGGSNAKAVNSIVENHYVDDWLESFDSEEEALQIANDVIEIHKEAKFIIRNFISNSKLITSQLNLEDDNTSQLKNLNGNDGFAGSKVLGMWWSTMDDQFYYNLNFGRLDKEVVAGVRKPTKREVLRTLMMVFDPLGFLSSLLIGLKILLQDIWRSEIGWDQLVTDSQFTDWVKWIKILPKIGEIKISRCYFSYDYKTLQLHVFTDASELAYAAVAYFRYEASTAVCCSLVAAKSKVAPLRPVSIPRLELQAAVLGARLANTIISGHNIVPEEVFFWTDSSNVLAWLRSDARKYKQFVALRIAEILETTTLANWRWVPSAHNVADDATKWKSQSQISSTSRWFVGPQFLHLPESKWFTRNKEENMKTENDLKLQLFHSDVTPNLLEKFINKCSQWRKAYRTMGWIVRILYNFKNKSKRSGVLLPTEIRQAKEVMYRQAQLNSYREEINQLQNHPDIPLEKSSLLYQLSPFLDEKGVLRMRGRTSRAIGISFDVKNPIILPRSHKVTELIVMHYHEKYLHANHETVVNELRQLYVISRLRVVLNSIRTRCQFCKNLHAHPNPPQMSDLPQARLGAYSRPFSYTGIDYFGPLEVVVGRRVEKRWVCMFTCLTVRAIHIELAHSLSKDSCMMCIRNFISRRGMPIELHTDNGTNFIGVKNELKKLIDQIPLDEIQAHFENITWKLNPPAAPHMGGSWERLVRSVKCCLERMMPTKRPDDENLRCYLLEVESIINSRPLTYLPISADEPEALTPNHFLLGSSGGIKPLEEVHESDVIAMRRNYKLSQQMALHFWKRWLHEYMPTLARRTKWFQKVKPIEVGDVVVIVEETKRNSWVKGVVVEVHRGRHSDQVRQVVVKTINGTYTRPATKVAVLDVV